MQALFIVAQENYHPVEYGTPKRILEEAGIKVIIASKQVGIAEDKMGGSTQATLALADINVDDYDAIVFVGGSGARVYQHDVQAHLTAQEAINRGKVLAAICIAPTILAYAGVLEGKKATVYNKDGETFRILEQNGATFVDEPVVVDGKIITANGPPAAEEFGQKILELMNGNK